MARATQEQCINNMLCQLEGYEENQTAKTSVWNFFGDPKNFITKAEAQGLEFIERHNDDLIFRMKTE